MKTTDAAPKEAVQPARPNRVLLVFFLIQGLGMLFPWNALLTASESLEKSLEGHKYKSSFVKYSVIPYFVCNVITLSLLLRPIRKSIDRALAMASFFGNALVFVVLLLILTLSLDGNAKYIIFMLLYGVTGLCAAIIQSNLFAISSRLGPNYSVSILLGQAISGTVASLINLIIKLVWKDSVVESGCIFYAISLIVVVCCFIIYIPLPRLITAELQNQSQVQERPQVTQSEVLGLKKMLKNIYPLVIAMIANFALTLMIFPGFTTRIHPMTEGDQYFIPITFLLFNIFDLVGRSIPDAVKYVSTRFSLHSALRFDHSMLLFQLIRWILIPLFALCPVSKDYDKPTWIPSIFKHDAISYFLISALAATSGAAATFVFVAAPEIRVKSGNDERGLYDVEKALCGRIMTFSMLIGLILGSLLAIGYTAIVAVEK